MIKRILFLIFILIIVIIINPKPKKELILINSQEDYSFYETRVVQAGTEIDLQLDKLYEKYQFDRIKFVITNNNIARINYKEKLLALDGGQTNVSASLYKGKSFITTIHFGKFIILKDISECIPIHNYLEFTQLLTSNPQGCYYLENDIVFPVNIEEIVPYFEGILLNPKMKIIKNLRMKSNNDCGLFERINNAIIDGLILEDVQIESIQQDKFYNAVGTIAAKANYSFLSNIQVSGNVKNGNNIGGLLGYSYNTMIVNSSFTGNVQNGRYVGGLIGYSESSMIERENFYFYTIKFENCYVIGNISGEHCGAFTGYIYETSIENSYFVGKVTSSNTNQNYALVGSYQHRHQHRLINVYHNIISDQIYDSSCEAINVRYIEDFKSGEVLEGMDAFIFQKGSYPVLKK